MDINNQQTNISQSTQATFGVEKFRKWKLFLFFIVGATGVIGSAVTTVWIYFRSKLNKKNKYIAVGLGLLFSTVGVFALQQFIFIKNPEAHDVYNAIQKEFSDGRVSIGLTWSKTFSNGVTNTFRGMTIGYFSKNLISADEMNKIAITACDNLEKSEVAYDIITVENKSSIIYPLSIPFVTITFYGKAPCEDWYSGQMLQLMN